MTTPIVTAMVLCEVAHQDPVTKRFTVRNICRGLPTPTKPCVIPDLCLYIAIEHHGIQGEVEVHLDREDEADGDRVTVLFMPPVPIAADLIANLTGMPIPTPGTYYLTVVYEGSDIGCLRLTRPAT